ncbi:MAG: electron transfer flavoprotein subunit beta/FixA family protein [Candidatus Cloacimonetes bacterium]|nr:electron transfer flavoprotein subunit beta/FixA family protein [Candidatus Cloacimonadota bacterium]
MNIIVCIKQVPDTVEIKINPETNTLIREGVESIINPFDMYAIEEGLRIKEKFDGKVTVLSMGPPQVESALREALALGIDDAILLSDEKFAGADTLATSYTLATAIKKIGDFDIIFFGKQAIDGDTAQVGPGVATLLEIPQIVFVRKIESIQNGKILAERITEDGYDVIESTLPIAISVVKEINEPRLPSLRGKMSAKRAEITIWNFDDLNLDEKFVGLNGSPTQVERIFTPKLDKHTEKWNDSPEEMAKKLAEKMQRFILK